MQENLSAAPLVEKPRETHRTSVHLQLCVAFVAASALAITDTGTTQAQDTRLKTTSASKEKQKLPPFTYDEVQTMVPALAQNKYGAREAANKTLDERIDSTNFMYLVPHLFTEDQEVKHRITKLVTKHLKGTLLEKYKDTYDDDWIDGPRFLEQPKNVSLPKIFPGAENMTLEDIIAYCKNRAHMERGAKSTGSPDWEDYRIGLQILAEMLYEYYALENFWTEKSAQEFTLVPNEKKAEWLDQHLESVVKKASELVVPHMEAYKIGSEKYRQDNNIPLKRPPGTKIHFEGPQENEGVLPPFHNSIASLSAIHSQEYRFAMRRRTGA
jgi:hypothetical protein